MKNIKPFKQFNEGVGTIIGAAFFGGLLLNKLLKFLSNKAQTKSQKKIASGLLSLLSNDQSDTYVKVYELGDKYVIRSFGKINLGSDEGIKILKEDKVIVWENIRIPLSSDDYDNFIKIIKEKF